MIEIARNHFDLPHIYDLFDIFCYLCRELSDYNVDLSI